MISDFSLRRHDLAYLRPDASFALDEAGECFRSWISSWIAEGKPLVVTRQPIEEQVNTPDALPVSLAAMMPARLGRKKICCRVCKAEISALTPALPIERILSRVPERVAVRLADLSSIAQNLGVSIGVYGSTAWEQISGEVYRHNRSDVDLVVDVQDRASLSEWLRSLDLHSDRNAEIDGEIRLPSGQAVAWRELARALSSKRQAPHDMSILAKGLHQADIVQVNKLLAILP